MKGPNVLTKKSGFLLLVVIAKFALQYAVINPEYELHRDEFLHLDQGRHLAWGYLSVPPFTSWLSWVIFHLGNSVFWVKFFPALFGALTMIVVWKTIETLKGGWFALALAMSALMFSALPRLNMLFQPNSLDILFWTLLYFAVVKFIDSQNNKWLWVAALAFGLGFLNKYNIAFLILGLLPALLLTEHRRVVMNKTIYFAAALALAVIMPNLVWQYQNHFPVWHHMKLLSETQLVNVERTGFLKEQVLFFFGSIWVLIGAFISFFTYAPFQKFRVVFWSYVFTLSFFVYLRAKGYYAFGLYPILFAFGAVYFEQLLGDGWKRYLRPVLVIIPAALFIPLIPIAFPIDSPAVIEKNGERYRKFGLLRWEDGKDHQLPQDFADMLGWKELAEKVDRVYDSIGNKNEVIVLCDNYGQAGAINYYSRFKEINAVSMNADYINWFPLDRPIQNIIMVTDADDDDVKREKERPMFERVYLTGRIENPFAREVGTYVFVLKNAHEPLNGILQEEIDKRK